MKQLMILCIASFGMCAMEQGVASMQQVAGGPAAETVEVAQAYDQAEEARALVVDILTNKDSVWLTKLGKDMSKYLAQFMLQDTNFVEALKPQDIVLEGHNNGVLSGVFSPDGKTVLTASWDCTAKLWDLEGNCIITFKGHTDYVRSGVFSPDGKRVLAASDDGTAKLLDLAGNCITTFKGHTGYVYSGVFSPDGKRVLTASSDCTAKLCDLEGKCIIIFEGHTKRVSSGVFSPGGTRVLTASDDSTARICFIKDPFLSKEVTLPQVVILLGINAVRWAREEREDGEMQASTSSYVGQLKEALSSFSRWLIYQEGDNDNNEVYEVFDFNKCEHLQEHYEALPDYIKKQCNEYVVLKDN